MYQNPTCVCNMPKPHTQLRCQCTNASRSVYTLLEPDQFLNLVNAPNRNEGTVEPNSSPRFAFLTTFVFLLVVEQRREQAS